jgi:glycogen(starch) synthase
LRILTVGAMYPPHYAGGYELVWRAFARHMNACGHDLRVLCTDIRLPDVGPAEDDPWVTRDLSAHVHGRQPPLGRRALFARERHNARVLDRALSDLRPDAVMWWHMLGVSLGLMERVRRAGLPALSVVHDEWPLYGPGHDAWLEAWRSRAGTRRLAARLTGLPTSVDPLAVDAVSFNSQWLRDRVLAALERRPDARVSVIPPGIPDGVFRRAPAEPWQGRLACVGRIDERKGLGVALEAAALVEDTTLTITGGGDEAHLRELRAQASERVRFEPPVAREELQHVYERADAVLFPVTWHEPWGLVPLEAMTVGRPVVATGTGGSGEYLVDGENALLVPPGDARALAAAVERLRDDAGLRERLVAGGLRTAVEHGEGASLDAMERELEQIVH